MRKIYYLLILIFSFSVLSAQEKLSKEEKARREKNIQAGNPFARFGYKAKVATLSNGKYLEFHDLDSIVSIGSVRWHVDKSQIVGRIIIDTLNPDAQPTGDTAGRWMSPDPLSEEFPSYSPYNFCLNNPMRLVDPTGMAPEDPGDLYNLAGAHIGNDGKNDNKVYLVNTFADTQLSQKQSSNLVQTINSPFQLTQISQVNITNDELNLRSSLATLKQTEAGRVNSPLDYNSWNNNKNFTEDSYANNPSAYSSHPGTNTDSGGSAAGAYQFLDRFYKGTDFSPQSQDKAAVNNMTSSSYTAAKSGSMADFKSTTEARWTSLKHWTVPQLQSTFNSYRSTELTGNSTIATPVGQLLKK